MYYKSPFLFRLAGLAYLLPFFLLFLFASCEKEIYVAYAGDANEIEQLGVEKGKPSKIDICHYDADNDTWEALNVSASAWAGHAQHGDVWIDQDNDGFVSFNVCSVEEGVEIFDCDDTDPTTYPGAPEQCDEIDHDCNGRPLNREYTVIDEDGEEYFAGYATFGASVGAVSGLLVDVTPTRACGTITNGAALDGNIALIDRGGCNVLEDNFFTRKAYKAELEGAIAVIICNNNQVFPDSPIAMGIGTLDPVTIPVTSLSYNACAILRASAPISVDITVSSACGSPALGKSGIARKATPVSVRASLEDFPVKE